jgi:hypothetical protein
VGLEEITRWNPVESPQASCDCKICEFTRASSKRWKLKYFILFQSNPRSKDELLRQVNLKMLQLVVNTAFQSNPSNIPTQILAMCVENGITSPSELFQSISFVNVPLPQRVKIQNVYGDKLWEIVLDIVTRKRKISTTRDALAPLVPFLPKCLQDIVSPFFLDDCTLMTKSSVKDYLASTRYSAIQF